MIVSSILATFYFIAFVNAAPADSTLDSNLAVTNAYAPVTTACPSTALVRPASSGMGSSEKAWFTKRKAKADTSLKSWLIKVGFPATASKYPSVGMAISGGGYRSMLEGGGVVQAFDSRDSTLRTAGLYQALTYQSGLSGGSFLVGSLAANNWPTVSSLVTGLWTTGLSSGIAEPGGGLSSLFNDARILADINAKDNAGFTPVLTDPWGRLISFQLFYGADGGVADKLSGITTLSKFTAYEVPYPIITAIETQPHQCLPTNGSPQMEMHPYEFGSWDSRIAAFTQTAYLGTNLTNGQPTNKGECIANFDNIGYVVGTSSSLFLEICLPDSDSSSDILTALQDLIAAGLANDDRFEFAVYPNPFYKYTGSTFVSSEQELHLVDGGTSNQNDPIWPFIQPARSSAIDVIIVNDNSADTSDNWPNGTEIYNTYLQAQRKGLTRMPIIPPPTTFVTRGLNKKAVFFGCNDNSKVTIIYLPNTYYTYPSNYSSTQDSFTASQIAAMIGNGNAIATQNGASSWPTCLACGIMQKSGTTLPSACTACFKQYCWTN